MLEARVQIFAWLMTYENLNQPPAYEVGMQQITLKNHEREPISWYVSDRPGVFNPYNVSDRVSKKTWYENVTYPDLMRGKVEKKKIAKVKYPKDIHREANGLFTTLNCP